MRPTIRYALATALALTAISFAAADLATAQAAPPAAPSQLELASDFSELTWVDNSTDEDGFVITVRLGRHELRFETGANETSLALPVEAAAACPASSATYEVRAFNAAGESEAAQIVIAIDCVPAAPSDVRVEGGTLDVLTWTDNSDNESGFRIYVTITRQGGPTTELTYAVDATVTRFELPEEAKQLPCPETASISIRVVAFNFVGESPASAAFSIACPAVDGVLPEQLPNDGGGPGAAGRPGGPLPWLLFGGIWLVAVGYALRFVRTR